MMNFWTKVRPELDEMANRHFETAEYRRLFGLQLTPERQAVVDLHYPHYIKSRRDCWAAASAKAPLDVKRAIWEHEKDELIFDKNLGGAHLTDDDMARATDEANLLPGVQAAFWAWFHLSTSRPWIEALTVNHITERKNNPAVVEGGGYTHRMAMKRIADMGGSVETLDANTRVHMTADVEHSNMFSPIYERYIQDEATARAVVSAARDSLRVDRAFRGALASAMMEVPNSRAA